ncbi:Uncharacterised protein [uncultured archaeon]|nr:Uncharacterised protein [uncultured archaeon]
MFMQLHPTKLVLALFALVSIASADTTCGTGVFGAFIQNGVCVSDLFVNMSTVVLLISFSIVALVYMIAESLQSSRFKSWAENELYQLLGTAIILTIYLFLVGALNFIGPAFYSTSLAFPGESTPRGSGGNWVTVENHAKQYVGCLFDYIVATIKDISVLNAFIGAIGSLIINLDLTVSSVYSPVLPGLGGVVQVFSIIIGAIAAAAVQLQLQMAILSAWHGLFNVLLPFGIVLRSFPYTRPAGAAMIAIVVGFTILLPIMYMLIEDVGYHYTGIAACDDTPPNLSSLGRLINIGFSAAANGAMDELKNAFEIGGWLGRMAFRIGIEATVLPIFAYLMVLNIVKRLAELLGGEIDLSSLVRLI